MRVHLISRFVVAAAAKPLRPGEAPPRVALDGANPPPKPAIVSLATHRIA